MYEMLTISDSISFKILNENTLIAGIGNEIRVLTNHNAYTLPYKLKGKVHGIEIEESSNNILVYGENEFILIEKRENGFKFFYRGTLTDWISSGKILKKTGYFVLVTAHSVALLLRYNEVTKMCAVEDKASCTDKSTLYCSYIFGSTWEQSLILGGNAFGELLVWQPSIRNADENGKSKLLHRTPGHNGVIFSIDMDMVSKLLITTSDDRSVRFWDISIVEEDDGRVDFERSVFRPRRSGYSHVARVFKSKIIHEEGETYVITGGEDSYVCLWNNMCELVFKRRQQFGATIWCLDYHGPTKTLITAGSSGNLLTYNLRDSFKPEKTATSVLASQSLDPDEYIAKIKFLNECQLIGMTNCNRLVYRNGLHNGDWVAVEGLGSYKCTVLEVSEGYVAVAGYQQVTLYTFFNGTSLESIFEGIVLPGVIRSFIFLSGSEFLISDEPGNCKLIMNRNFDDFLLLDLPQCKERWVTSACKVDEQFLALSNRQGSLMVCCLTEEDKNVKLCDTVKYLHGHLGATTVTLVRNNRCYSILMSTGHDKTIKTIKFDKKLRKLTILSREIIPISWVEKAVMLPKTNTRLLFGFNDNHFVLWSREVDVHFEIPCGGGHRCWDMHLRLDENRASMIFIKNKKVYLHQETIFNKSAMPLDMPRNEWHVKPCNALCAIKGQGLYLVSGGDDNLLKISHFTPTNGKITQLHEIHTHISSIRGLKVYSLSPERHLIFSCGGRAQICVTELHDDFKIVEDLVDYTIQRKNPSQNFRVDPETRVMSIDVRHITGNSFQIFVGCSDGFIRQYSMPDRTKLSYVDEFFYGKCILHVRIVGEILITVATDGNVCFWEISTSKLIFKVPHHETGVNSFDVRVVEKNEFHLLTGGDDQKVVYSKVIQSKDSFQTEVLHRMDYIHTAQVTAVKLSQCLTNFYSSSVDQIVTSVNLKTFTTDWQILSCVADVKGIGVIHDADSSLQLGFLYGCGLQVLNLSKKLP